MKTSLRLISGAVFALLMLSSAQEVKPNFTGAWSMISAKSRFASLVKRPKFLVYEVEHNGPALKILIQQSDPKTNVQQEDNGEINLTVDGEPITEPSRSGDPTVQSVMRAAKWSGSTLVLETTLDIGAFRIFQRANWKLSQDGKSLTVVQNFVSFGPDGKKIGDLGKSIIVLERRNLPAK